MDALEDSYRRDVIRPTDYNDALATLSEYVSRNVLGIALMLCTSLVRRAQRAAQKLLKRSLGVRIWSRGDIAAELKRISDDLDLYLNVHTVCSTFQYAFIEV